jgi:hypothetical protein
MNAPTIPITVVMMNPLGSRPGVMNFATKPARKPIMMVHRICIGLVLSVKAGRS